MDHSGSFNPFEENKGTQQYGGVGTTTTKVQNTVQPTVNTEIVDNYEPFSSAAVIETTAPPAQSKKTTTSDLEKLERDLAEREKNLARAEQRNAEASQANVTSIHNFPPMPAFCCFKPCFYQDIDVDIPAAYQVTVRMGYYLWIAYSVLMLINCTATLAYMIDNSVSSSSGSLFGVSLLLLLLFVPLSYVFWFRFLYKAFRSNSSFSFFAFFFVFAVQIVILIIQVIGIKVLGSSGWIVALTSKSVGVKIYMLIVAGLFTAVTGFSIFLILRVNTLFRSSGGSYQKAKEEMATSSTVRNATAEVVRTAAY